MAATQELKRSLTFAPLFFIVVANMIGTGIFTTSGYMMADLGNPWAVLACWVLGGVLALCGGLCYAELGTRFPIAGGEYVFLRETFGLRWSFLSGWVSLFVGFSAPIAAAGMAFGTYAAAGMTGGDAPPWLPTLLAVGAVVTMTLVHLRGLLAGARIQVLLTGLKVLLIGAFIFTGLGAGEGDFGHLGMSVVSEKTDGSMLGSFATSLIFVSFAYTGWNAAVYLGGEVAKPARDLPRTMLFGTLLVMAIYVLLNVVFIYALAPSEMAGREDIGRQAAVALFGPTVGNLFAMAIALFLLSTIGAMTMTGPRVYYAMAKDGAFLSTFAQLSGQTFVPARAVLLQGALAVAMVLTATFEALLIYAGFILSLFASLTVLGLMWLRRKEGNDAQNLSAVFRTWGYPVTPLIFVGLNLWIVVFSVSGNRVTFIAGVATLAVGYTVALLRERASSSR